MFVFQYFKNKKRIKKAAICLYDAISCHCRRVEFYRDMGLANDVDGRFHLQLLLISTLCFRLNKNGVDGGKISQALFDVFFKRVEMALREQGIGDMGIPRRMKARMEHFNGCSHRLDTIFPEAGEINFQDKEKIDQLNIMVDQLVFEHKDVQVDSSKVDSSQLDSSQANPLKAKMHMRAYYNKFCERIFQMEINDFIDKKIDFATLTL